MTTTPGPEFEKPHGDPLGDLPSAEESAPEGGSEGIGATVDEDSPTTFEPEEDVP